MTDTITIAEQVSKSFYGVVKGFDYKDCMGLMMQPSEEKVSGLLTMDPEDSWETILDKMEKNKQKHREEYQKWTVCTFGWKVQKELEHGEEDESAALDYLKYWTGLSKPYGFKKEEEIPSEPASDEGESTEAASTEAEIGETTTETTEAEEPKEDEPAEEKEKMSN